MKSALKKILNCLKSLPVVSLFVSCIPGNRYFVPPMVCMYGMPENYKLVYGHVYDDLNDNGKYDEGEGITGIKISASYKNSENKTEEEIRDVNSDGIYSLYFITDDNKITLTLESSATAANVGKYKPKSVEVDFSDDPYLEDFDIPMEPSNDDDESEENKSDGE